MFVATSDDLKPPPPHPPLHHLTLTIPLKLIGFQGGNGGLWLSAATEAAPFIYFIIFLFLSAKRLNHGANSQPLRPVSFILDSPALKKLLNCAGGFLEDVVLLLCVSFTRLLVGFDSFEGTLTVTDKELASHFICACGRCTGVCVRHVSPHVETWLEMARFPFSSTSSQP